MPDQLLLARTPPLGWCIVILALYALVAVPVIFWGLRRSGARGLAWVLLPILVAVATGGLWFYVHGQVSR